MPSQASRVSPHGLLKPFIWLALLSFLLGFSSFLVAGADSVTQAHERVQSISAVLYPGLPAATAARPI